MSTTKTLLKMLPLGNTPLTLVELCIVVASQLSAGSATLQGVRVSMRNQGARLHLHNGFAVASVILCHETVPRQHNNRMPRTSPFFIRGRAQSLT